MAETENISKIADLMSKEIFKWLKWEKQSIQNVNWNCVQKKHKKDTHPSDIVFYYNHPYSGKRIYLNTDLKSYAKTSIQASAIGKALVSLAMAVDCANLSQGWKDFYLDAQVNSYEVQGLLFIYNHDGEYDQDFGKFHKKIDYTNIKLNPSNKLAILGPDKIRILHCIASDISKCKADEVFTQMNDYTFYYPDMILSKVNSSDKWNQAAILEQLNSGWITLNYRKGSDEGFIVYYLRTGETVEEFEYFIDYLSHYQLLLSRSPIKLKFVTPCKLAAAIDTADNNQVYLEYGETKWTQIIT